MSERTEHVGDTGALGSAAVRGMSWTFVAKVGQQVLQFVVATLLARILGPDAFGTIALLLVFVALATVMTDGGFGKSLIQKQDSDDLDASSMFYFNIVASLIGVALIWLIAPAVSMFYAMPELTWLLRVLSLGVILSSFSVVQTCLFTKRLHFRPLLVGSWSGVVCGGVTGIAMALNGYGVWSLVGQSLVNQLVRTLTLWVQTDWRPQLQYSKARIRELAPFGSRLFIASLIDIFFQNLNVLVIGKFFSQAQLGYYNRANAIQQLPVGNFLSSVNQVSFPLLSRIQNDQPRVRLAVMKSVRLTSMVLAFGLFLLMFGSEWVVLLLLGDKWTPSIEYLRLFCFVGMIVPLQATNVNAIQALGRADVFLRFQIMRKVTVVLALLATVWFGIVWIIVGQIASQLINFSICGTISRRLFGYGTLEQVRDVLPCMGLSLVSSGLGWMIAEQTATSSWLKLLIMCVMATLIYWAGCAVIRVPAYVQATETLGRLTGRRQIRPKAGA